MKAKYRTQKEQLLHRRQEGGYANIGAVY